MSLVHTKPVRTTLLSAALAPSLLLAAANAHPIVGFWDSPTSYSYKLEHLTDMDQQRTGLPPPFFPPGPGGMYCGPTTGINIINFIANHGYPTLLPAGQLGDVWQQAPFFAPGTTNIFNMGVLMNCSPTGGTGLQTFANGMRSWIGNRPITVSYFAAAGTKGPTLNQIASTGLNKSLMALAYGYYQHVGTTAQGIPIVKRNGGHFVTISGASRNGAVQKLWVRDPADEQPPQYPTQSNFSNRKYTITNQWVLITQPPFAPVYRWVSRMTPGAPEPLPGVAGGGGGGGSATFLLMDAVVYARPKQGLAVVPGGGLVAIQPVDQWQPGQEALVCAPIAFGAPVLDAAMHPDQIGAVVLAAPAAAAAGVAGEDLTDVQLVNPATGESVTLAQIEGATKLYFGRDRALSVLAGDSLHRIDLPVDFEEDLPRGEDPGFPEPVSVALPFAAQALTYDDATDEVVLLSLTDAKIMRFASDLSGKATVLDVPGNVALGASGAIAVNPIDNKVWLVSDASDSLFGLSASRERGGGLVVEELALPEIVDPKGLDFDDEGHMIVSAAAGLIELQPALGVAAAWTVVDDSPFGKLTCEVEDVIRVDRSRNNFIPEIHDTPEWVTNIDPVDLIPGVEEPDAGCLGDLNGDELVNAMDVAVLLGTWGPNPTDPADFDGNGIVNGFDLAMLLAAWGPCGPKAVN